MSKTPVGPMQQHYLQWRSSEDGQKVSDRLHATLLRQTEQKLQQMLRFYYLGHVAGKPSGNTQQDNTAIIEHSADGALKRSAQS